MEQGTPLTNMLLDEGFEAMDRCIRAIRCLENAVTDTVIDPEEAWKKLERLFRAILDVSAAGENPAEALVEGVIFDHSGPPLEPEWTIRILRTVPGCLPETVVLNSSDKTSLSRVQVFSENSNGVMIKTDQGLEILTTGLEGGGRFLITQTGRVLDMRPEAFMSREGLDIWDYQKMLDPALGADLKILENERAELEKANQMTLSPRDPGHSAQDIQAAFDDIDRAEKNRRKELGKRLENLSKKEKQPRTPHIDVKKSDDETSEDRSIKKTVPDTSVLHVNLCSHCGNELFDGKPFCASCGNPVHKAKEPKPQAPEPEIEIPQPETCPQCNSALKSNARFCVACGTELAHHVPLRETKTPSPPSVPLSSSPKACSYCGHTLRPKIKFCTSCGKAIDTQSVVTRNETVAALPSFCTACGGKMADGAKFCQHCGNPTKPGASPTAEKKKSKKAPRKPDRPKTTFRGPGMMNTAMTYLPGLFIDFSRQGPLYLQQPERALNIVLPCTLSIVSVGLAPRLGKWFAIILVLLALGWLAIPFFSGGTFGQNAGRGLVGATFFYTIMRLLRSYRWSKPK